jgi:hypothetical protein
MGFGPLKGSPVGVVGRGLTRSDEFDYIVVVGEKRYKREQALDNGCGLEQPRPAQKLGFGVRRWPFFSFLRCSILFYTMADFELLDLKQKNGQKKGFLKSATLTLSAPSTFAP